MNKHNPFKGNKGVYKSLSKTAYIHIFYDKKGNRKRRLEASHNPLYKNGQEKKRGEKKYIYPAIYHNGIPRQTNLTPIYIKPS